MLMSSRALNELQISGDELPAGLQTLQTFPATAVEQQRRILNVP